VRLWRVAKDPLTTGSLPVADSRLLVAVCHFPIEISRFANFSQRKKKSKKVILLLHNQEPV
jgi:hypothetical protein